MRNAIVHFVHDLYVQFGRRKGSLGFIVGSAGTELDYYCSGIRMRLGFYAVGRVNALVFIMDPLLFGTSSEQ